jgi:hypothetical protein
MHANNFHQQFREVAGGGLPLDAIARMIAVRMIAVTSDNLNNGTMKPDTVIKGRSYTTVILDEFASWMDKNEDEKWFGDDSVAISSNQKWSARPPVQVDVYRIEDGCAIDVQEINETVFGVPKIVDNKWIRVMSQRKTLFTDGDIFSNDGEDYIIFAYPPSAAIDVKKCTISKSYGCNIPRDIKWVVRIDRSLVTKGNYILTEV